MVHSCKSIGRECTDSCHGAPLLHIGAPCSLMWRRNELNAGTVGLTVNAWITVDSGTKGKGTRRYSRSNGGRKTARHLGDPASGSDSFESELFCDMSLNTRHVMLAIDNYTELYLHKATHHAWCPFPFMSPNFFKYLLPDLDALKVSF